jgi:hypothetical protein
MSLGWARDGRFSRFREAHRRCALARIDVKRCGSPARAAEVAAAGVQVFGALEQGARGLQEIATAAVAAAVTAKQSPAYDHDLAEAIGKAGAALRALGELGEQLRG